MKTTAIGKVRQAHGGALNKGGTKGNKGNKGGTGRPPEAFKSFLAKLRQSPKLHDALKRACADETSRGFSSALKVLTDYDTDKPAEKHSIVGPIEVRVKIVREGRRTTAS